MEEGPKKKDRQQDPPESFIRGVGGPKVLKEHLELQVTKLAELLSLVPVSQARDTQWDGLDRRVGQRL